MFKFYKSAQTMTRGPISHYLNGENFDYGYVHNVLISLVDPKESPPMMYRNQNIINQIYF